jgi:anti-sigma regulatory factor (Ser/Thr protein kinase)
MRLPPTTTSPRAARQFVRSIGDPAGAACDDACWDDIDLVVSELVTNAVLHARTDLDIEARLVDDAQLEIRVSDGDRALPTTATAAFDERGGAGVSIIEHVAIRWGVERWPGGKTVWCRLPLRPVA